MRETFAREFFGGELAALNALAGIKLRELVGEVGRREPREARPIDLAGHVAAARAFERLRLSQDALAGKMIDKCALRHEKPPKIVASEQIFCSKATGLENVVTVGSQTPEPTAMVSLPPCHTSMRFDLSASEGRCLFVVELSRIGVLSCFVDPRAGAPAHSLPPSGAGCLWRCSRRRRDCCNPAHRQSDWPASAGATVSTPSVSPI